MNIKTVTALVAILILVVAGGYWFVSSSKTSVNAPVIQESGQATTSAQTTVVKKSVEDKALSSDEVGNAVYSIKKGKTYYYSSQFGGDPGSLKPINNPLPVGLQFAYAVDASHVYIGSTTITGADPVSFKVISDSGIAQDFTYLYIQDKAVAPAPHSISLQWKNDYGMPSGFRVRSAYLASIDGKIFMVDVENRQLKQISGDSASVVLIEGIYDHPMYFKDRLTVYCASQIDYVQVVVGADPATFRSPPATEKQDVDAVDANHKYYQCKSK